MMEKPLPCIYLSSMSPPNSLRINPRPWVGTLPDLSDSGIVKKRWITT